MLCHIKKYLLVWVVLHLHVSCFLYLHNICPHPKIHKSFQNSEAEAKIKEWGKWIHFLVFLLFAVCRAHIFQVHFHNKYANLLQVKQNRTCPVFLHHFCNWGYWSKVKYYKFFILIIRIGNRSALFFHLKLKIPLLFPHIYVALPISYI